MRFITVLYLMAEDMTGKADLTLPVLTPGVPLSRASVWVLMRRIEGNRSQKRHAMTFQLDLF
jgi:hypothetical protein